MSGEVTEGKQRRSDAEWIQDLAADGLRRESAMADLRHLLVTGLQAALRDRPGAIPVEDFAHEALIRITAKLETFRRESRFTTWAMAIAVRVAASEMRRARWRDVSLDEITEAGRLAPIAVADRQVGDGIMVADELLEAVRVAIANDLSDRQRSAIEAELGGLPPDEIADRLNTNRNAVYKLVYDARRRLRNSILAAGWTEEQVRSVLNGLSVADV